MTRKVLSVKDPSEYIFVTFDFTAALEAGETITAIVSVTVDNPDDPSASSVLQGLAQLAGNVVKQEVRNGVAPTRYHFRATVTTSLARRLVDSAYLPVETT